MFLARLRPDGTILDAPPLLLTTTGSVWNLFIAATDRLYFATFEAEDGVHGTRITPEGAVLDRDTAGDVPLLSSSAGVRAHWARPAGLQNRFVLLLMSYLQDFTTQEVATYLDVVTFVASAGPKMWPRTELVAPAGQLRQMPAMAVRNGVVAIAYQRLAAESGDVRRAFLRLYTHGLERRRAAGR